MEVSGRNDHVLIREHVRIVGRAVDFIADYRLHVTDIVLHGTMNLRYAAERVRVLDMLLWSAYKFASIKQFQEIVRSFQLALVTAQQMSQLIERLDTSVVSLQRHCTDAVSPT